MVAASLSLMVGLAGQAQANIVNGSFESGFTGWGTQDLASPFMPLHVGGAGESTGFGFFTSAPTDGSLAALHGFDGGGPGTIRLFQDVFIPTGTSSVSFDYRGAWDMQNYGGSTQARLFDFNVQTAGGGSNLYSTNVLSAAAGTSNLDTGDLTSTIDVSQFGGSNVRLSFDWNIPQSYTGPGFFQFDNVQLNNAPATAAVPEPETYAMMGMGLLMMVAMLRKKKMQAMATSAA